MTPRKQAPEAYVPRALTPDDVRAWRGAGSLARVEFEPLGDVRGPGVAAAWPKEPSARQASVPSPTRVARPTAPEPHPETGATMLVVPEYTLVLDDGRRIDVEANGVIGRSPQAAEDELAVAVEDPERKLSRSHLRFERDALRRLWITDLRSANGTEIVRPTGARVECEPGRRYALLPGDLLLLGDATVRVESRSRDEE